MRRYIGLIFASILFTVLPCASARGDSVMLTSGTASTLSGIGTVNLLGVDFSLRYLGEIPPGATNIIGMNSVTLALGLPLVQFNGVGSSIFTGSLMFSDSQLIGNVLAYASIDDLFLGRAPIFSVNFSGAGFLTIENVMGSRETRFTIATATPEPATMFLLLTGLTGAATLKRRRARQRKSGGASNML